MILSHSVSYTHLDVYKRQVFQIVGAPLVQTSLFLYPLHVLVRSRHVDADCPYLVAVSYTHLDVYKRQVYDPQTRKFVDNPKADAYLNKTYRSPWQFPNIK